VIVIITNLLRYIILLSVSESVSGEEGRSSLYLRIGFLVAQGSVGDVRLVPLSSRIFGGVLAAVVVFGQNWWGRGVLYNTIFTGNGRTFAPWAGRDRY